MFFAMSARRAAPTPPASNASMKADLSSAIETGTNEGHRGKPAPRTCAWQAHAASGRRRIVENDDAPNGTNGRLAGRGRAFSRSQAPHASVDATAAEAANPRRVVLTAHHKSALYGGAGQCY